MSAARKTMNKQGYAYPSALEQIEIPDYEGMPVTETLAKITKTGDGLSESMSMRGMHIPSESKVMVLVYATAKSHRHDRVTEGRGKDAVTLDEFAETVTLEANGALLIDPDLVSEIVETHQARVAEARSAAEREKREAKGEFELPLPSEGEPASE